MKFALMIRGQYRQSEDMVRCHQDDLAIVRRAEALGFDAVGKASHYSATPWHMAQQIPFLAQVAAIAPKLRIITGVVLLPLHKPFDLAEQLATLDVMSGGKLIFGAGVGYREVEFRFRHHTETGWPAFRGKPDRHQAPLDRRHCHDDRFPFRTDRGYLSIRPVQRPMPPIWIGANADIGIRRAARMADAWMVNPHNTLETLDKQMALYRRELDHAGKPFPSELPMIREVFVASSREEAIRLARPSLEAKYKAYRDWGQDKMMPAADHFDRDFTSLMADRFLLGTPAEIAEQILALRHRFGVNYFCVGVHLPGIPASLALEQIEMLAQEVFPIVKAA